MTQSHKHALLSHLLLDDLNLLFLLDIFINHGLEIFNLRFDFSDGKTFGGVVPLVLVDGLNCLI
jgi:hypothetical protein